MSFLKNYINHDINTIPANSLRLAGGNRQKWNILDRNASQDYVEHLLPVVGEGMVKQAYELKKHFEFENPRIIDPEKYNTLDELLNVLEHWWIKRMRKRSTTFTKRRAAINRMAQHPVLPINFFNLNPDQSIAHLDYREEHYDKDTKRNGKDAIINDWKTIKMVAKAYDLRTDNWNYNPPERGKPKHKIVPLPKDVHRITHHDYSNDPYENALYQYMMQHNFIIGWRVPSEPAILKIDDIHIDDGYVHFYQPKVDAMRMSELEPEIMTMSTRKSFKNWIDKWRPKVVNQYSGDFVYLQPNGKPFTHNYLRKRLGMLGKQVWEDYHPYVSRDWCAIARLIKTKIDTGSFDIYEVYDWFEHSELKVTESYIKAAKKYYKLAPFDWVKSVLKFQKNLGEENGLKSKKPRKTTISTGTPPRERYGPTGIRTPVTGSEGRKDIQTTS